MLLSLQWRLLCFKAVASVHVCVCTALAYVNTIVPWIFEGHNDIAENDFEGQDITPLTFKKSRYLIFSQPAWAQRPKAWLSLPIKRTAWAEHRYWNVCSPVSRPAYDRGPKVPCPTPAWFAPCRELRQYHRVPPCRTKFKNHLHSSIRPQNGPKKWHLRNIDNNCVDLGNVRWLDPSDASIGYIQNQSEPKLFSFRIPSIHVLSLLLMLIQPLTKRNGKRSLLVHLNSSS